MVSSAGAAPSSERINNHAAFIWSVADLLRGDYKQSEYGKVILPLTVLRRFDCMVEPHKPAMLKKYAEVKDKYDNYGAFLDKLTEIQGLWNTSEFDLPKVIADPANLAADLEKYIAGFSPQVREILGHFDLTTQIRKLDKANLLYKVLARFVTIDLHPNVVSNIEMGYLYEELIRRFSELSNETAGEHFTPREVIRLMVDLLFEEDDDMLAKPGVSKTIFDPACGTGGMLSVAEDYLRKLNPKSHLLVFGQELNPETYAICRSDMMLKGQNADNIKFGNSFSEDGHEGQRFDYLLANPPFGVEWKKVEEDVKGEYATEGFKGRFGAGLPRINDGSFLFLQHMISKMKRPEDGGSRVAIVFNGSPLFTGAAGSGESEIRRWIIEHDWLDAVVALPDQLFYNTGISTYFWIVTNRKTAKRRGKVQLIDVRQSFTKMRKSLGDKRKQLSDEQIADIVRLYGEFAENDRSKIFPNEAFGFMRITVERPLRLRWEITDDTLSLLAADKKLAKLDDDTRTKFIDAIAGWQNTPWKPDGIDLRKRIAEQLSELGAHSKAVEDASMDALAARDLDAPARLDKKGDPRPDPELRDNENVPLPTARVAFETDPTGRLNSAAYRLAIDTYVEAEVRPYVPDAWVDYDKTKIGYEIPLTRHFYVYKPPRPLAEIDAEIMALENETQELLKRVTE